MVRALLDQADASVIDEMEIAFCLKGLVSLLFRQKHGANEISDLYILSQKRHHSMRPFLVRMKAGCTMYDSLLVAFLLRGCKTLGGSVSLHPECVSALA